MNKQTSCRNCSAVIEYKHPHRKQYCSPECREVLSGERIVKYRSYKSSADRRGIAFGLSFDEFLAFWNKPCAYCGDDIKTIGIDRINSKDGYFVDNCTPCCTRCNMWKFHYTLSDFIDHCNKIATHTRVNSNKNS